MSVRFFKGKAKMLTNSEMCVDSGKEGRAHTVEAILFIGNVVVSARVAEFLC